MSDSTEQNPGAPEPEIAVPGKLFDFARDGETAALAQHLDEGVPVTAVNESGDSLVMLAAYYGQLETVEMLLARGADPNHVNDRAQTPLAGAVFKGQVAIVRALLAAGADPNAGFPSAIEAAQMFGKPELLELFASAQ